MKNSFEASLKADPKLLKLDEPVKNDPWRNIQEFLRRQLVFLPTVRSKNVSFLLNEDVGSIERCDAPDVKGIWNLEILSSAFYRWSVTMCLATV